MVEVNGLIFMIGGQYDDAVYTLDTKTDILVETTDTLPRELKNIACIAVDDKIYGFGGSYYYFGEQIDDGVVVYSDSTSDLIFDGSDDTTMFAVVIVVAVLMLLAAAVMLLFRCRMRLDGLGISPRDDMETDEEVGGNASENEPINS